MSKGQLTKHLAQRKVAGVFFAPERGLMFFSLGKLGLPAALMNQAGIITTLASPHSQIEGVILMILLQALTVRVSEDPSSTCAFDRDGALDWTSMYILGKRCWTLGCTPCAPTFLQVSV